MSSRSEYALSLIERLASDHAKKNKRKNNPETTQRDQSECRECVEKEEG